MKGLQGRDWSFCVPPDSSKWSPVRTLPWATVSRGFIGVSSCRRDWLWASSSALLSPEVVQTQSSSPLTTMRLVFLETTPPWNYLGPTMFTLPDRISSPTHFSVLLPDFQRPTCISLPNGFLSPEVALFPRQQAGSNGIHSAWRCPYQQTGKVICRDFTHWMNRGLRIWSQRARTHCTLPNLLHWLLGLINPRQQPGSNAARMDRDSRWWQPPSMSILLC